MLDKAEKGYSIFASNSENLHIFSTLFFYFETKSDCEERKKVGISLKKIFRNRKKGEELNHRKKSEA